MRNGFWRMQRGNRNGFGLIEIMVVVLIIMILAAWLLPRYLSSHTNPVTKERVAAPRERALQVAGAENISQINQAIFMYQNDHDGKNPASLDELKTYGVTDSMLLDPVTKRPLPYDPTTGKVGASNGVYSLGGGANLPQVGQ